MDEVGRGTSTEDGLSIAWAVCEYVLNVLKSRTFFATHYHELTRIQHNRLQLLCLDVQEREGQIVFTKKIRRGASENSYGLHVARLAGIPQAVIERAQVILESLQKKTPWTQTDDSPLTGGFPAAADSAAVSTADLPADCGGGASRAVQSPGLFSDEELILDEILSAEPDNLTPLEALQLVARWKKHLSGK